MVVGAIALRFEGGPAHLYGIACTFGFAQSRCADPPHKTLRARGRTLITRNQHTDFNRSGSIFVKNTSESLTAVKRTQKQRRSHLVVFMFEVLVAEAAYPWVVKTDRYSSIGGECRYTEIGKFLEPSPIL